MFRFPPCHSKKTLSRGGLRGAHGSPHGAPAHLARTGEFGEMSENCQSLHAYWHHCKAGRTNPPALTDIHFRDIHHLAGNLVIKDAIAGGSDFQTRYWGAEMTSLLGFDATGLRLADYACLDVLDRPYETHRTALKADGPIHRRGTARVFGRPHINFEVVLLPLMRGASGKAGHIISLYDFAYTASSPTE